jgi:hypothetical protein
VIDKDNEKQHENPKVDPSGSSRIIIEEKREIIIFKTSSIETSLMVKETDRD